MSPRYPERKFAALPLPNHLVAQCVIAARQRAIVATEVAARAPILRLEAPHEWSCAPWLGEDLDLASKADY